MALRKAAVFFVVNNAAVGGMVAEKRMLREFSTKVFLDTAYNLGWSSLYWWCLKMSVETERMVTNDLNALPPVNMPITNPVG